MSDRHAGYVVVLSEDAHVEDSEEILNAIRMIKGVARVEPVTSSLEIHIAQARSDEKWRQRIVDLLMEQD